MKLWVVIVVTEVLLVMMMVDRSSILQQLTVRHAINKAAT